MDLNGTVSIVTGGARGIGYAIAQHLLRAGGKVVICDSDVDALQAAERTLAEEVSTVFALECDVTKDASIKALIEQTVQRFGRIDILINNAGVGLGGPFEGISIDAWQWIIDINLLGIVRATQAVIPRMVRQGSGHIVNTASSVGLFGDAPHAIPYVTTKTAVVGMSRALALYLAPKGVGVTVLCPDNTDTTFRETARVEGVDRAAVVATLPKTQAQSADEVASALIDGLRSGSFLVPLTPGAAARMSREAQQMYAPQLS